jgi:membrane protein implicated in regulation of membrane protease activity
MDVTPPFLVLQMLNVLLKLIVTQPQLLLTHAENYADLFTQVCRRSFMQWQHQWMLYALSVGFFVVGVACAAVALLLYSALPALNPQSAWVLVVLPAVLLVISAVLFVMAKQSKVDPLMQDIQEQIALDILAIRKVSTQ